MHLRHVQSVCPIILVKVKNKITNLKTHLPSRLHPTRSLNKEQTVKDSFTITIPSLAVEQTQNPKTKFLKTLLITDKKTVGLPSKRNQNGCYIIFQHSFMNY